MNPIILINATPSDWMLSRITIDNVYINHKRRLPKTVSGENLPDPIKEDWKYAIEVFKGLGGGSWDASLIEATSAICVTPNIEEIVTESEDENGKIVKSITYKTNPPTITPTLRVTTVINNPDGTQDSQYMSFSDERMVNLFNELVLI